MILISIGECTSVGRLTREGCLAAHGRKRHGKIILTTRPRQSYWPVRDAWPRPPMRGRERGGRD